MKLTPKSLTACSSPPLAGGNASGPAEPVPRRFWNGSFSIFALQPTCNAVEC